MERAIADADGLLASDLDELTSVLTELWSALVSFGKSLLASLMTAFALS